MTEPGLVLGGLGIQGYRSMPTARYFGPFGKVTLLAGQNDVGKSNVIRFLDKFMRGGEVAPEWHDRPIGGGDEFGMARGWRLDQAVFDELVGDHSLHRETLGRLLAMSAFHPASGEDLCWVHYAPDGTGGRHGWRLDPAWLELLAAAERQDPGSLSHNLGKLCRDRLNESSGQFAGNASKIINLLFPLEPLRLEVVSAFRHIDAAKGTVDHSGGNLIQTLANHQNPNAQNQPMRDKFEAINQFVSEVLERPGVLIEVPYDRDHLLLRDGTRVLPLDSVGTGIHQTVILAAAATLLENTLVCIEEPEVNLHPILQRKLVRHLAENTSNQYIITTHSAHMLDYEKARVVHLRLGDNGTESETATSPAHVSRICTDLGYRPSDLIQANAVIWVEGPSDRIYLRHWMNLLEPNSGLIEGIHYSVMFYGGRLMNHLTANEPDAAEDLISLRRINRHSMIMIDSDRTYSGKKLGATKDRVIEEFNIEGQPGHAWLTWGYTIENYVPVEILSAAVRNVHKSADPDWNGNRFTNPLGFNSVKTGKPMSVDKNRIAKEVCASWTDPETLSMDLAHQIGRVTGFIRDAN